MIKGKSIPCREIEIRRKLLIFSFFCNNQIIMKFSSVYSLQPTLFFITHRLQNQEYWTHIIDDCGTYPCLQSKPTC